MYRFKRILVKAFCLYLLTTNFACSSFKNIDCIINDEKYQSIKMRIPKYKKTQTILAGGESGKDYIFWYKDSCAIYISYAGEGGTLNYDNVRNQPGLYSKRFKADSIMLSGTDQFGRYWKEYKKDKIYIGYYRVKSQDKNEFDLAVQSLELINSQK